MEIGTHFRTMYYYVRQLEVSYYYRFPASIQNRNRQIRSPNVSLLTFHRSEAVGAANEWI